MSSKRDNKLVDAVTNSDATDEIQEFGSGVQFWSIYHKVHFVGEIEEGKIIADKITNGSIGEGKIFVIVQADIITGIEKKRDENNEF